MCALGEKQNKKKKKKRIHLYNIVYGKTIIYYIGMPGP